MIKITSDKELDADQLIEDVFGESMEEIIPDGYDPELGYGVSVATDYSEEYAASD